MRKKIFTFLSIIIIFIIIVWTNPIILNFLTGTARILNDEIECKVYIDDREVSGAKVFISKSDFYEREELDYLILYLWDIDVCKQYPVLIIDKKDNKIKIPNASKKNYDLFFAILFQSDSGANVMIPIDDKLKGLGFEPNLKIEKNHIEFELLEKNKIQKTIIKIEDLLMY
jgi:hypothetical protein